MDREPIPPETCRADVLGRLQRERWHAADAKEAGLVAQLDRRIQALSAGTATSPSRETTGTTASRPNAARTRNRPTKGIPRELA